jgi:hypothetical protein
MLVKTTKIGKDTTFEKLIDLMEGAGDKNSIEAFVALPHTLSLPW